MFQETRVRGEKTASARAAADKLRSKAVFPEAKRTTAGGVSGGCAVTAKKGIGISGDDSPLIPEDLDHRACHAWVNGVLRGGLHCFSA